MRKPLPFPPTPAPFFPVQGWTWRLSQGSLLVRMPTDRPTQVHLANWDLEENADQYYQMLQRWLQLTRFWYYVVGQPMVHNVDYLAVRNAAERMHQEFPEENPMPLYWWHNHLQCRYDDWCQMLFSVIPPEARRPRFPWVYGEPGIFNCPLDFTVAPCIMEPRKLALPPASFQFK